MSTKKHSPLVALAVLTAAGLSACATQPLGPTVQVLPASNKPFEVFQNDQAICKQYADQQIAGEVDRANERGVGAAVLTTALGAGLGAAVGGGRGAAIGAGAGGVVGSGVGADSSGRAESAIQYQYNNAYVQCMYSKGNQVAGQPRERRARRYAPPPREDYPPPPPGYYPPPDQR